MFGLSEDPGIGYSGASNHDSVTSCGEHGFDVLGRHDVSVTDERDRDRFLDALQPGPVSKTPMGLGARAAVQCEHFGSGRFNHFGHIHDDNGILVPAKACFDRNREFGAADGCFDDLFKQGKVFQESGAFGTGHMILHPATAIDVDEIRVEGFCDRGRFLQCFGP